MLHQPYQQKETEDDLQAKLVCASGIAEISGSHLVVICPRPRIFPSSQFDILFPDLENLALLQLPHHLHLSEYCLRIPHSYMPNGVVQLACDVSLRDTNLDPRFLDDLPNLARKWVMAGAGRSS